VAVPSWPDGQDPASVALVHGLPQTGRIPSPPEGTGTGAAGAAPRRQAGAASAGT